jgi:hypothetical protein
MASLQSKTVGELTVAELQQLLQSLSVAKSQKAKKDPAAPKKEVSAGVAAWNAYVTEVKEELGCTRKEAMLEASKRKAAGDADYAAASAARRAKRDEQLAKKVAPASAPSSPEKPAPAASAEKPSAERPKKVLSPEHLAKMQAAAKAAREAKKAAAAPAPAPVAKAPEPEEEWIRKTISGKKHLWNPSNNHCYRCEADGSQGEWAGLYDPKSGKIDDSVEELPLCADCEKKPVTAKGHRYCEACK